MSGDQKHSDGRRTIGFYIPFETAGVKRASITFEPSTFGVLLRWEAGMIPGAIALMLELSGYRLHELEAIRHPDDQRVMAAFLEHVQPKIADDIRQNVRPLGPSIDGYQATGEVATPATDDLRRPEGASGGDPLGQFDEFEQSPERPLDHIPGLDD